MRYSDLHVHTTFSDGIHTPEEIEAGDGFKTEKKPEQAERPVNDEMRKYAQALRRDRG